jgi:hypothetical protein
MASIQLDAASGYYRIRFRFAGKAYFRSLDTRSEEEANSLCGRAETVITAINQGFLVIPKGADPADFILAGGKHIEPPSVIPAPERLTLEGLLVDYTRALNPESKESSSLGTEAIHRGHLTRHLGRVFIDAIRFD